MSAYAEYKYAKTEEEREEALRGIKAECRRQEYWDEYEYESGEYEDEED